MSICGKSSFDKTRWSVVRAAGDGTGTEAHAALSTLCKQYWYPLYAFVRRQGRNATDAQDLTQGFFLKLLEKDYVGRVDRRKGKFRTFLLTALRRFMADEWDAANARKRGGGQVFISIDDREAESRYQRELSHDITPEKLYDRHWALALLEQVLFRLRDEYEARGKTELFDQLKLVLTKGKGVVPYADMAAKLGMSEGSIKVAAHRLRRSYARILREEVAQTASGPEEVEEELRDLFASLSL
jgi:RNA polymerase sigma factor (sigma-70 family)